MNNNLKQNSSVEKLESQIFLENFVSNLLANEIMNYVSPSRKKSLMSTEFIVVSLVKLMENQKIILSELKEIKKTLKK